MKDKYKVVIVGFAHVHINDVAKHFTSIPVSICAARRTCRPTCRR